MARNEEKAHSMLNRFLAAKADENKKPKERRPVIASECRDLAQADKWRQQILREIGRKVMEIQNAGLGEERLRDLNDEINKLLREKGHWEKRIVELHGPDYSKSAPQPTDGAEGEAAVEAASGKGLGYRYFGAAKNLPGVKELFEKPPAQKKKRTRYEMFKCINADYYGYRDEEDGVLLPLEAEAEALRRQEAVEEWERAQRETREARAQVSSAGATDGVGAGGEGMSGAQMDADVATLAAHAAAVSAAAVPEAKAHVMPHGAAFVAHVPLPDTKQIEKMVLQKKKEELLSKYASQELRSKEEEAKDMLNIRG
eukprot:jgi/Mesvir1/23424/Mv21109-RA.1